MKINRLKSGYDKSIKVVKNYSRHTKTSSSKIHTPQQDPIDLCETNKGKLIDY